MMVKICPKCNKETGVSSIICPSCGTDLYLVVPTVKVGEVNEEQKPNVRVMGPATKIKRSEWINFANKVNEVDSVSGESKIYSVPSFTEEKNSNKLEEPKEYLRESKEEVVAKIAKNDYIMENPIQEEEQGIEQSNQYVKYCQVCGGANYLSYKDEYLASCRLCGQENINDMPTVLAKAKSEEVKVPHAIPVAPPVRPIEKEQVSSKSPIVFKQIPSNKEIEIPVNGGVIGRYGDIAKDFFSGYEHISGNHLRIINENNEYYIQDLNSTNGTKINGSRINSLIKYKINNGCMISISTLLFEVMIK